MLRPFILGLLGHGNLSERTEHQAHGISKISDKGYSLLANLPLRHSKTPWRLKASYLPLVGLVVQFHDLVGRRHAGVVGGTSAVDGVLRHLGGQPLEGFLLNTPPGK